MILWTIAVGIVMTALVTWYVFTPLLQRDEGAPAPQELDDVGIRYRDVLWTILQLEADYETGKLSRKDFETAVGGLKIRAAKILMELEEKRQIT